MKTLVNVSAISLSLLLLGACASNEVEVPLSEVPDVVLAAAREARPGIELTEAELETEDGVQVYELEGELDGVEYEIEVSPSGEVLEIEAEDAEDE